MNKIILVGFLFLSTSLFSSDMCGLLGYIYGFLKEQQQQPFQPSEKLQQREKEEKKKKE